MFDSSDDYDFCPTASTKLSSLFESDITANAKSLTYTAPKQPRTETKIKEQTMNVITSQQIQQTKATFYKFVDLHQECNGVNTNLGKHVAGLIKSVVDTYEILVYQSKKNILIRRNLKDRYAILKKYSSSILLCEDSTLWSMKFYKHEDYDEFVSQYVKLGGKYIEKEDSELITKKYVDDLPQLQKSEHLKTIESVSGSTNVPSIHEEKETNSNQTDILQRVTQYGLPVLRNIPFNIKIENNKIINDSTATDSSKNTFSQALSASNGETSKNFKQILDTRNENETDSKCRQTDNSSYQSDTATTSYSGSYVQVPPDVINSIQAQNHANHSEIMQNISQISIKLDEVLKGKNNDSCKDNILETRINTLELKSSYLESEMATLQNKFTQILKFNSELLFQLRSFNKIETFCANSERDEQQLEKIDSGIKNICTNMDTLKNLSQEFDDGLTIMEEYLKNQPCTEKLDIPQQLSSKSDPIPNNLLLARNNFVKDIKGDLREMYHNIMPNLMTDKDDQNEKLKSLFIQQIRTVTSKLIEKYDKASKHCDIDNEGI